MKDITIYKYDPETDGDKAEATFSPTALAKAMDLEDFAEVLQEFLNWGMKEYADGYAVGHRCRRAHRTIQRSIITFALGIIAGMAEQEHWDERNATAITTAKKLREMIADGQLPVGMLI